MQKLKVIFEDNHIIVVEKPVNIPSQGDKTGDIDMLTIIKEYLKAYICQNVADTVVLSPDDGASHILTLAFKNLRGEVLLHALEKKCVLVGIGSACSSHRESRFKKLLNLDADHRDGIVRLSFSEFNTLDEAKEAAKIIADTANEWNRFVRK